jgi:nicotinamide-nucleotide adenylyltransferase
MNKERALLVGRFNPFHLGHLKVVEYILEHEKELIIAIGTAQQSHTRSDPFTAGERVLMIHQAMKNAKIPLERIFIIPIPDIFRNPVWVSHLQSYCPPFTCVYTNNSLIKRLFSEAEIEVKSTGLFDRKDLIGSRIRERMINGEEWQKFVPNAVIDVINLVDGLNRLKNVVIETD